MANPKIEVEIGAVIDGLRKGFGDSVRIIETLEKQALDLDKALRAATDLPEIQNLNAKLAQTKAALSQLRTSGIDPLTKATSGYNAVGVDFARIIQDAPFGIIGVGNNIQQLAFSFQELRNQSTSTGAALKQAFLQIISPGNALVLVVSLITTALTAYQMGVFDSKEETKDLEKETETYDQTLRKLIGSLNAVDQARLEGSKGAADELVQLDLLNKALTDSNQPQNVRIAAYKKLKEEYPSILSNITQEQALANGLGDAYFRIVSGITQRASAIAIEEKLVELAKQRFDILEKEDKETLLQNDLIEKQTQLRKTVADLTELINSRTARGTATTGGFSDALKRNQAELAAVNEELSLLGNVIAPKTQSELQKNDAATEKLKNNFFNLNLELTDFFQLSEKSSESTDKLKRSFEDIQDIELNLPKVSFEPTLPDRNQFELPEANLTNIQSQIQALQALDAQLKGSGVSIQQFYAAVANGAADGFDSLGEFVTALGQTQQFINETFQILEQGAENTIGDVAFAIGDALGSGGNVLKAAGSALLGGIAGILNQLGQLAIATGLAVEGIKKALQTLNPAVAIGAGVALVALAGFVSSKAKSLGGSRGGGGGGGSSVGASGVGGGSEFVGTGAQGGMFASQRDLTGELVVRGQDLVYVFGQANNRINKG